MDTSAYFASVNRRDANHARASRTLEVLTLQPRRLFTTNFILAELHALLLTRVNRSVAAQVLSQVDESRLTTIVRVSARDEQRARQIIFQYQDKNFSLTDATSFAVMERLHISTVFTYDHNFAQYGWVQMNSTSSQ